MKGRPRGWVGGSGRLYGSPAQNLKGAKGAAQPRWISGMIEPVRHNSRRRNVLRIRSNRVTGRTRQTNSQRHLMHPRPYDDDN